MPPEISSETADTLNPSASETELDTKATDDNPSDPTTRINNLMSNWQKEQAETKRLRELVTAQITAEGAYKQQIADLETKANAPVDTSALTELQGKVAALEAEKRQISMENTRLTYLRENPDLLPYAEVLPLTGDRNALEAAGAVIKQARGDEVARLRGHLTTPTAGGSVPRRSTGQMSPAEIETFLNSAKTNAEFEERLKQLQGVEFK